jgi:hypothetical protein
MCRGQDVCAEAGVCMQRPGHACRGQDNACRGWGVRAEAGVHVQRQGSHMQTQGWTIRGRGADGKKKTETKHIK